MKKFKSIIFFTVWIISCLDVYGQPKLLEEVSQIYLMDSAKWRNAGKTTYQYEGNLMTEELIQVWFSSRNEWGNRDKNEYFYDGNGQVIQHIHTDFNTGTDTYQNLYTNTFDYNDDGCLIKEDNEIVSIHGVYAQTYRQYEVGENCQKEIEYWQQHNPSGEIEQYKNTYTYDDEGQLMIDSLFFLDEDNWINRTVEKFEYDTEGRLILKEDITFLSFSINTEYEQWNYDENGGLTLRVKWRVTNTNPFKEISKDSIIIAYDEQDRIAQQKIFSYRFSDPETPKTERYQYFCENILKSKQEEYLPFIYKYAYIYDIGFEDECLKNLEDPSIVISPNPTSNSLQLQSDLLGGEQAKIYIFDVLGRQFLEQAFPILKNTTNLDVSFLERGLYILSIENGERISAVKFYKE